MPIINLLGLELSCKMCSARVTCLVPIEGEDKEGCKHKCASGFATLKPWWAERTWFSSSSPFPSPFPPLAQGLCLVLIDRKTTVTFSENHSLGGMFLYWEITLCQMQLYKNIISHAIINSCQYISFTILNTLIFIELPDYSQDLCQANHEAF